MLGQVLDGKYRVLEKLGEGGMGEVYLVEHLHLERKEALKILRHDQEPNFVSRLRREARAANRLGHPNIVAVHELGKLVDGRFYLAMEYVEGESLSSVLARGGALPMPRAVALLDQLAAAVEHAHSRGVVHRDLKPDNLLLARGGERLKVLDFGIAKISATIEYQSPEQLEGGPADVRSDLYSLGCIAYELVTGAAPFTGQIMDAHRKELPRPPSQRRPQAAGLDQWILRCLEKDPARRFPDAHSLRSALAAAGQDADDPHDPFGEMDTVERRFEGTPSGARPAKSPADDKVRQLAELLVDLGQHNVQLVIGLARAHELEDELVKTELESAAISAQLEDLEQRARLRENAIRFALGELQFDRNEISPAEAPPTLLRQIAAFEKRLVQLTAETRQQREALLGRAGTLSAAGDGVQTRRQAHYSLLEQLVLELAPLSDSPAAADLLEELRQLRRA